MTWMKMPGQTWAGAAASCMAMWTLMMLAMMLPSFVPMLLSYRTCMRATSENRLGALTSLCGAAYFFVWAMFGAVAYALGLILVSPCALCAHHRRFCFAPRWVHPALALEGPATWTLPVGARVRWGAAGARP